MKKSALGTDDLRRRSRRSFERTSGGDPFDSLPAVQRVDSDDVESGEADSEPGGGDSATQTSPRSEDLSASGASLDKRSPRMEANKPTELEIPGETSEAAEASGVPLKTPGGSLSAPSPAGKGFMIAGSLCLEYGVAWVFCKDVSGHIQVR